MSQVNITKNVNTFHMKIGTNTKRLSNIDTFPLTLSAENTLKSNFISLLTIYPKYAPLHMLDAIDINNEIGTFSVHFIRFLSLFFHSDFQFIQ